MAKKAQTLGRGKKQCPKCNTIVGAKTAKCECGHIFVPKTKKTKGKTSELGLDSLVEVVQAIGGAKGLKQAIFDYDKVVAPIEQIGGIDTARAILSKLETIKSL